MLSTPRCINFAWLAYIMIELSLCGDNEGTTARVVRKVYRLRAERPSACTESFKPYLDSWLEVPLQTAVPRHPRIPSRLQQSPRESNGSFRSSPLYWKPLRGGGGGWESLGQELSAKNYADFLSAKSKEHLLASNKGLTKVNQDIVVATGVRCAANSFTPGRSLSHSLRIINSIVRHTYTTV